MRLGAQGKDPGGAMHDVFGVDMIAKVAAEHERGLQLLVVDACNTTWNVALPGTLRYLFLRFR